MVCSQYISYLISIISSIVLGALQWSFEAKWLAFLFCFVFRKEGKYFFWKMKISQNHPSMFNVTISGWHSGNCLDSAHAPYLSQSQGTVPFSVSQVTHLVNWFSTEESPEIESFKWSRKSTFDWRIALEFVSQSEVETDYASRITKFTVLYSQYWKGREPIVHSYYCHTYRTTSHLSLLLHLYLDNGTKSWKSFCLPVIDFSFLGGSSKVYDGTELIPLSVWSLSTSKHFLLPENILL